MKRILTVIAALALVGYTALGIHQIVSKQNNLQLNEVRLRSTTSQLKELQLKYDQLNSNLDKELHNKNTDEQRLKQLESEKQELEKQKQELEKQLQARLQQKAADKARAAELAAKAVDAVTFTATASAAATGSSPQDWMEQAGIPQSDWVYVDCVINGCQGVSAEGGWGGTQRWNTAGSGAYGLCQALPGSKMASAGADWATNPITQLRWCNSYAQGYGGWAAAWTFRKCTGSCYSPRTNTTVYKDHTWW